MSNTSLTSNNTPPTAKNRKRKPNSTTITIKNAQQIVKAIENDLPRLRNFSLQLYRWNTDDANDLYQDTIYRILENKDKFIPLTNFKAWTSTIMKNLFINEWRKKKNNPISYEADNTSWLAKPSNWASATSMLAAEQILAHINSLEESIRIPFLMHYEWFKYQEIEVILDLPLWTVKSRIFFARKKLKEKIWADYFDEN